MPPVLKTSEIGLRQGIKLCNMRHQQRIEFIAQGLPVILGSAQSLMQASRKLNEFPREAEVLARHAEEECAKILILLDIVRCPGKLVASRIGPMMKWFYDHLARLLYAKAQTWKPTTVQELQDYIDSERKTHYLEGEYNEFVAPNWELYMRESSLYTDIVCDDNSEISWHTPLDSAPWFIDAESMVYRLVEALAALGIFSLSSLVIMHDIWNAIEFVGDKDPDENSELVSTFLHKIYLKKLIPQGATEAHVQALQNWQIPMYHINFTPIQVSLEELRRIQERSYPY